MQNKESAKPSGKPNLQDLAAQTQDAVRGGKASLLSSRPVEIAALPIVDDDDPLIP